MIEKLNSHYSMTNPASVYDEEALTSLELAGRTTAKVNEVVNAQNELDVKVNNTLDEQNKNIENIRTKIVPADVSNEVQKQIVNGTFDEQIDKSLNNLNDRVDNLLGSLTVGGTTSDAELIDMRVDVNGITHENAGISMRENQTQYVWIQDDLNNYIRPLTNGLVNSSVANSPLEETGAVQVDLFTTGVTDWVVQSWLSMNSHREFTRHLLNDKWTEWKEVFKPQKILIQDNLNLYITPNVQGVTTIAVGNIPIMESGLVDITSYTSGLLTWIVQRWISLSSGREFTRHFSSEDVWSEWIETGKPSQLFIEDDLNNHLEEHTHAVARGTVPNSPLMETGLIDIDKYTTGITDWIVQRWLGVHSGRQFTRVFLYDEWSEWVEPYANNKSVKNVVFLGDSIFGINHGGDGIVKQFEKLSGYTTHNFALGGTRAKARSTDGWGVFDAENLITSIISGDFSSQESAITSLTNEPYYFETFINNMKAFDFTTADIIICNWGTNDWFNGLTTEEYTTVMNENIRRLCEAFPQAEIIKCTQTERYTDRSGVMVAGSVDNATSSGDTLKDYVEADFTLADTLNIRVVDLLHIGINIYNKDSYFSNGDYVHHNANGRVKIAEILAKQL